MTSPMTDEQFAKIRESVRYSNLLREQMRADWRSDTEHERNALFAEVERLRSQLAEFAADVNQLIDDYSDPDRDVIAKMPFAATLDQIAYEKYGISLDGGES